MAVLSIDYRLAPEHPFPAALQDADAALRWLAKNGPGGPDPPGSAAPQLCVAGDSAGGGLAAALALRPREEVGTDCPAIAALALFSPWMDLSGSGESHTTAAFDPQTGAGDPVFRNNDGDPAVAGGNKVAGWGLEVLGAVDLPLPEQQALQKNVGASPLFAGRELLRESLPPTLVQTGEAELLLSDSTEFAKRCAAAGVGGRVELEVWPRLWHCFHQYSEGCGLADGAPQGAPPPKPLQEAVVATERAARFLRTHVDRSSMTKL